MGTPLLQQITLSDSGILQELRKLQKILPPLTIEAI